MGEPAMMWCCVWLCQCSACLLCEGWALLGFFFIFADELLSTDSPSALPPALILPSLSRSPCWEFGSSSDSALVVLVLSCVFGLWVSGLENTILTRQCRYPSPRACLHTQTLAARGCPHPPLPCFIDPSGTDSCELVLG